MGCDSQFDRYESSDSLLERENKRLQRVIAQFEKENAERERDDRGYDLKHGFYICHFDRTVTDSMDEHDRICTKPVKV